MSDPAVIAAALQEVLQSARHMIRLEALIGSSAPRPNDDADLELAESNLTAAITTYAELVRPPVTQPRNDDFEALQRAVRHWNYTNWPEKGSDLLTHAAKVNEEVGEVLGAIIKSREAGRVRPPDEILEEFGDVLITVLTLADVLRENGLTTANVYDLALEKFHRVRHHRTAAGKQYDADLRMANASPAFRQEYPNV